MNTRNIDPTRLVGHLVTNETGTHHFCLFCVAASDPAYGVLHEVHANQVEAAYKCSICDRRIDRATGPARSTRFIVQLQEFYKGDVPSYLLVAGKTFVIVSVSDWQETKKLKITVADIVTYHKTQIGKNESGMRTLAGHSGEWRAIDNLADEVLDWFKHISGKFLEREFRKAEVGPSW